MKNEKKKDKNMHTQTHKYRAEEMKGRVACRDPWVVAGWETDGIDEQQLLCKTKQGQKRKDIKNSQQRHEYTEQCRKRGLRVGGWRTSVDS